MEQNSPNKTANRGDRKYSTTLMIWGDQEAIICPWYLHVSHGRLKGLLLTPHTNPTNFSVDLGGFIAQQVHVIKN